MSPKGVHNNHRGGGSGEKSNHKRVIVDISYKELDFWDLIPIFKQAAIDQEFAGFDIDTEFKDIHRDDYYRLKNLLKKYISWRDLS